MKLKFKKRYLLILLAVLAAGGWFYLSYQKKNQVEYTTSEAKLGRLIQTVTETGSIKPASEVSLNFLATGKLAKVSVKIGDEVKRDQVLAELDYSNLVIQQRQAAANLEVARANLAKVLNGASAQDVTVSQATVNQAKAAYDNALANQAKVKKSTEEAVAQAQKTLSDLKSGNKSLTTAGQAVLTAQTSYDNAKRTYAQTIENRKTSLLNALENQIAAAQTALDAAKRVLDDRDAENTLSVQDKSFLFAAEAGHETALGLVAPAKAAWSSAKTDRSVAGLNGATDKTLALLNQTLDALNDLFAALGKTITSADLSQAELDAFKSSISGQISLTNAGISAVNASEQALNDAIVAQSTGLASAQASLDQAQAALDGAITVATNNLSTARLTAEQQQQAAQSQVDSSYSAWRLAQAQLNRTVAPARAEDRRLAEAQVTQAQASLDALNNQVNNNLIKAPIDGRITQVNYEVGEEPSPAKPVIALLGHNNFEIEIDISEADIVKVKQGDQAALTFDSLGEAQKFSGQVSFIEPAQTVIQDVVYYKTTVSGITALDQAGQPWASSSAMADPLTLVRPGMTANVTITTATKDQALIVPNRAVIDKGDGKKIIRLLVEGQVVEVAVSLGLRGDDGLVEVLSGLKPGDSVITSIKDPAQASQ